MSQLRRILCLLLVVAAMPSWAGEWLPQKPQTLVSDYSGILSAEQVNALEQRLVAFNDSTSNQIVVVVTPTIGGDDENAAAQRLGEAWGVGQTEFDNGVVILIKSKTADENWGAVAIATGYGAEGALPDIFCKRIIDDQMLPALGDGDYYRAIVRALDVIEPAMAGEYSFAQYRKDERRSALMALLPLLLFIAVAVVVVAIYSKKHPGQGPGSGGGIYFGGPVGGTWGSGTWGGGSSSGGFGGFGGFGGGSFGGGGASGRF